MTNFSNRYKVIKKNEILDNIEKNFPILERLNHIFELSFDSDNSLNIFECCDGCFFEKLSVGDLRQLSKYFSKVAKIIDKK